MGRHRMTPEQAREHAEAKRGKVKQLLEDAPAQMADPAVWERFLAGPATFARADGGNYSARNMLLIFTQFPDATDVAGYVTWKERGRRVRKGETGILILAPVPRKGDDEGGEEEGGRRPGEMTMSDLRSNLRGVRASSVFDISQTDPIEDAEFVPPLRSRAADLAEIRALVADLAGEAAGPVLDAMDAALGAGVAS